MDGNGRWAESRGLPRTAGHHAGGETVRRVAETAPALGIAILTLFAFSSDNWQRPTDEVGALMALLQEFLRAELRRLVETGTRLTIIGRRDRVPEGLKRQIEDVERATAPGRRLHLRLAIDYSSRDAICRAAIRLAENGTSSAERFGELLSGPGQESVDLVIRSGGEMRLSDFLLWESAYAELWFTGKMWPDFDADDLRAAIDEFRRRERRFGALPPSSAAPLLRESQP